MNEFKTYQKGINLGGWLSQCEHTKQHYDTFLTKKDLHWIKEHGYDHVRLPVDYELLVTDHGEWKEDGFSYIDRCISWCKEEGLYMILDLHKTKGYTFDEPKSAYNFFKDPSLTEFFLNIWEEIARRYKNEKIIAFELLNEIVPYDVADQWNRIAEKAIERIRVITKDTYILVGGVCYNSISTVPLLKIARRENVVYTFHCYEPFIFTHQEAEWVDCIPKGIKVKYPESFDEVKTNLAGSIQQLLKERNINEFGKEFFEALFEQAINYAKEQKVPLYCGEYGVICYADELSKSRWFQDIEEVFGKYKIGHASWNYKSLMFGLHD